MATTRDVLEFVREKDPRLGAVPDERLIDFVGSRDKRFLDIPEFKTDYRRVLKEQRTGEVELGTMGKVGEFTETAKKSFLTGLTDVFASVPKSIALGATAINRMRGDDTPPEELTTFQLGEIMQEWAREAFPVDEKQRETWTAKISQGLGSAVGFLAGGGAAGFFGKSVGLTGIATLGSAASATEFYEDAKANGAEEDTAFKAALIGSGVGLTEVVPLNRILSRVTGSASPTLKKAILDAALEGGEEAVQETVQSLAQNVTAQELGYDPERGTFTGLGESAGVGGTVGVILSGVASALGVRFRGRTESPVSEEALEQEIAGEVPVAREQVDEGISNVADIESRDPESFPELPEELGGEPSQPTTLPEEAELEQATLELEEAQQPETETQPQELAAREAKVAEKKAKVVAVKREQVVEETKTQPVLVQNADSQIEEDIKPESDSIVGLGVISGPMTPLYQKKGEDIVWDPTELVQSWPGKVLRYARRGLVGHTAPIQFSELRLRANAEAASFNRIAKENANDLNRLIKQEAKKESGREAQKAKEQRLLALANAKLMGREIPEGELSPDMITLVNNSRNLIDTLSEKILDFGFLEGELPKSIRENLGTYLTRTYRVFDPVYNWNYNTVPQGVKDRAAKYIAKTQNLSDTEADNVVRGILNPDIGMEWMLGKTQVRGIPVSSFIKRKNIPKEIRDLLGEVRNPLENIMKTTNTVSQIVTAFELQDKIADLGLETGLFSKEQVGEQQFPVFGEDVKLNRKYPSLAPLFTTREMAEAMREFYGSRMGPDGAVTTFLLNPLRKLVSIGKFNQVILNLSDAFPVNLLGAVMVEIANGRIIRRPGLGLRSLWGLATRHLRRTPGKAPTIQKIEDSFSKTGQDFIDNWNSSIKDVSLMEGIAKHYGAIEDHVVVRDIVEGWIREDDLANLRELNKGTFSALPKWAKDKVFNPLGNIYAYPDNAMKLNAFLDEALTYAKAYPERSMKDIFRTAADITRATTPVYSKVPKGLRELSLVGIIPTYISFTYEMFRNTLNTVIIGAQEMKSSNAAVRKRGSIRMAGAVTMLSIAAFAAENMADWVRDYFTDSDDLSEQDKKDLNWLVAPWDRHEITGVLNYKRGEEFTYANLSYQIPQAVVVAPAAAALKEENVDEAFKEATAAMWSTFFGGAVLPNALGEVIFNKKTGGGRIYNDQLETFDKVQLSVEHMAESAVLPGFMNKIRRMKKAADGSGGSYGRVYSMTEETLRLFSVRPNTYNIPEASRFRMADFMREYQEAARIHSDIRSKNLPEEEAEELLMKEEKAKLRLQNDYESFIEAMLRLGVDPKILRENQRNLFKSEPGETKTSVPKDLRDSVRDLL